MALTLASWVGDGCRSFTGGLSDLFSRFHRRKPTAPPEEQCPPCEACGQATPAQQLMNSGDAAHAPCNVRPQLSRPGLAISPERRAG
jgi:hypothetical protein